MNVGKLLKDDWVIDVSPWEHSKIDQELDTLTMLGLFEKLDEAIDITETDPDERKYDGELARKIYVVLASRLEYALSHDINKELRKGLIKHEEAIEELNKRFSNHRHDKDTSYSEKPVW